MQSGERRTTVYDIARALGISASTVSRVLNRSVLISDSRRDLILETADRMGYRKRTIRRPASRSIATIRLLVPGNDDPLLHLFYDIAELLAGLRDGFSGMRVNIVTDLNDGRLSAGKKLGDLDGVICAFTEPDAETVSAAAAHGTPLLLLNRMDDGMNYVAYDSEAGMDRLVGEAAARRQNLKPCYIGFSRVPVVSEARHRGVAAGCAARGIPFSSSDAFILDSLEEITETFIRGLMEKGCNAVFAFNDVTAIYVYCKAAEMGIAVPDRFSLTGFDCSPVRRLVSKRIDTVRLSARRLGSEAARWMRTAILERNPEPLKLKIPGEYVPGDTL